MMELETLAKERNRLELELAKEKIKGQIANALLKMRRDRGRGMLGYEQA